MPNNYRSDKFKNEKFKGLYVEVSRDGDKTKNLEYALKKLKRMIKDSELMLKIYEISYYTKPSEKHRDERSRSKARARSATKKAQR